MKLTKALTLLGIALVGGAASEAVDGGTYRVDDALRTAGAILLVLLVVELVAAVLKGVRARKTRM